MEMYSFQKELISLMCIIIPNVSGMTCIFLVAIYMYIKKGLRCLQVSFYILYGIIIIIIITIIIIIVVIIIIYYSYKNKIE